MAEHAAHKHKIMINPAHKGELTERAKAAGMSLSAYEAAPHSDPGIRKEVQFAKNAKKFHHGK